MNAPAHELFDFELYRLYSGISGNPVSKSGRAGCTVGAQGQDAVGPAVAAVSASTRPLAENPLSAAGTRRMGRSIVSGQVRILSRPV